MSRIDPEKQSLLPPTHTVKEGFLGVFLGFSQAELDWI